MKHKYHYELYYDRIWKLHLWGYNVRDVLLIPHKLIKAVSVARSNVTYYPEKERKNFCERLADNIVWVFKNLESNSYYNSYGLDIKNFRKAEDFMPFREFKLQREGAHYLYQNKYRFSGQIILRDKYIFNCYLAEALGKQCVPKLVGLISNGQIHIHDTKENVSIEQFLQKDKRFFCKLLDGECAEGAFLIEVKDGRIRNGNVDITIEELKNSIGNATMIAQEVIEQHEAVNKINPFCVNTIRIITIRGNSGNIHVFAASMRFGTKKDSFVDNRAVGGSAVGIDEYGRLKKYGYQHKQFGSRIEKHPVTEIVFEGYQLPYWDKIVALVEKAHRAVINIQSVGWDVAITPTNPILIEGNDNWEIQNPQDSHGGLRERWYKLINDEEET